MMSDQPNSDEGASAADDVTKQNPGQTTSGDVTGETDDAKSGDLAKAGRSDFDPNEGAD